jgi:hypothetical protein
VLNRSGDTLGSVTYVEYGTRKRVALSLVSVPSPGTFLTTGNNKSSFSPPPSVKAVNKPEAPVSEIIRMHSRRVMRLRSQPVKIADAERLIRELQTAIREEHVRRGLYVPA